MNYFLRIFISAIWLLLLFCVMTFAQEHEMRFSHITNEDGLSNITVKSILQDSRGFMWFGTADGLNRYDGYQMTVYRHHPSDTTSLINNDISHLYEDSRKRIWVTTAQGIHRYDKQADRFFRYSYDSPAHGLHKADRIKLFIYEDGQQTIWAGTPGGLYIYQEAKNRFIPYFDTGKSTPFAARVTCIIQDNHHNLWFGTDGAGLYKQDKNGNRKHFTHDPSNPNSLSNNSIFDIQIDQEESLWISTFENGIMRLNQKGQCRRYINDTSDPYSLSSNVIKSFMVDRQGRIWIGTQNGGLNKWDAQKNRFIRSESDLANPFGLSQQTVSSIAEDNQGSIWIGTHRGGINKYSPKAELFQLYTQGLTQRCLSYKDVKAFCEDEKGDIYVGTDGGGLNVWNRKKNSFRYFTHDPLNSTTIGSDAVLHVLKDSDGEIWVGTWKGGLNKFNPKQGTFARYVHNPKDKLTISSNTVRQILEDRRKRLWVATRFGGLNLFDKKTGTFKRVGMGKGEDVGLNVADLRSLAEDYEGNLWVGSLDKGLFRYDERNDSFISYPLVGKHITSRDIRVIFRDNKGILWVGGERLYRYDHKQNQFHEAQGIQYNGDHETVQSIESDCDNNLWISTNEGLLRYNPQSLEVKRFTKADGLQGIEFGPKSSLKTSSGELLFGGINGFNIFHPNQISSNEMPPPVYLTDFLISNKSVKAALIESPLKKHIVEANEIILNYEQSAFSFTFAALNYIATEKNEYAYMLEGFDKDWQFVKGDRSATYTNLDPGKYVFKVKASNNDGVWNEQGASLDLTIKPPFWMTWWFRIGTVLILLSVSVFYLLLYRRLEIRKINEQKMKEMHQMQLQFFTNISHEFRTPLSLIMGGLEKVKEHSLPSNVTKYFSLAENNTQRLSHLINELLNFKKAGSGMMKLQVEKIDLTEVTKVWAEDFHLLAEQRNIHFEIQYTLQSSILYLDKNIFEKIMFNLLNNAFKYSKGGSSVSLKIYDLITDFHPQYEHINTHESKYKSKRYSYFVITDTGIGIAKDTTKFLFDRYYRITDDQTGTGIGLAFVKTLTLLHKGFIKVYSKPLSGTEILIALPTHERDYSDAERAVTKPNGISNRQENDRIGSLQPTVSPIPQVADPFSVNGQGRLILLVEDNIELRTFIGESLLEQYQVLVATDGAHAKELLIDTKPDMIISDVMMPNVCGMTLCKYVKGNEELSHIPFMLLTAKDSLNDRLEGVSYGADYYLAKPISIRFLLLTVQNIFAHHQKLKLYYLADYQQEIRDVVHSAKDREFLDRVLLILEDEVENPDLNVEFLCQRLGTSQTKFYKRLKKTTGKNITEFVRTVRLKKAAYIMRHEDVTVREVMHKVGISSSSYFTVAFKKEFGKTPSQYLKKM